MGKAAPAIPEFRARGHARHTAGSGPAGVAFIGRTSTGTLKDPVVLLARRYRAAAERLPGGMCIVRSYWDVESGGIELDARSQDGLWREFADAGIPRDGGMADLRAAVASGERLFSAVICEDINRVGRDMLDSLRLEKELRTAGVLVFAPSEPIDAQAPQAFGHVHASIREDALTAKLSNFLDQYALGYDRAARLAELIPASQAQQDHIDHDRAAVLGRKLKKAETATNGIAAEIGQLAGKTDPVSNAIRDRLTAQFSQRYDETTVLKAELQAIEDTAPLPDSDLSLIDELPYAPGLLAQAPDELRERLAAAFALQAVYRQDTRQATIVLTITDTTPAIIDAILADPRIDHDTAPDTETAGPATSPDTSVDVSRIAITTQTDEGS